MRARQINVVSNSANIVADLANLGTPSADNPAYVKARPGLHLIDKTIIIPSYTTLDLTGCTVRLSPGHDRNILRNKYAQTRLEASRFSCSSLVCTVTEYGHSRSVGDVVYIAGLATNTTLNGPQTLTGVTTTTWAFAITDATAPTGYGNVSIYNPVSGANFVRSSNVVTVTEAGHGRRRGDAVYVEGLLTDTSFNGAVRVKSVSGDTWTYDSTGADGSPTGMANVLGDTHIALLGGEIDYDVDNQSIGNQNTERFACIFGNIGRLDVHDQIVSHARKYAYWTFNSSDASFRHIRLDTESDGVHFEAPGYNPRVLDVSGRVGDDLVAFTNVNGDAVGAQFAGYAAPSGLGDFEGIDCSHLYRNEYSGVGAIVRCVGNAGYSFGDISVSDVHGYASIAAVAIYDGAQADLVGTAGNSVSLTRVGVSGIAGGTPNILDWSATGHWRRVSIDASNIHNTDVAGMLASFSVIDLDVLEVNLANTHLDLNKAAILFGSGAGGTLKKLAINGASVTCTTAGALVQLQNSAVVVDTIHIDNVHATGPTANAGYVVLQNAGQINRIFYNNVYFDTIDSLLRQGSGITADIDVFLNNVANPATAGGYTRPNTAVIGYSGGNIFQSNCRSADTTNNFLQLGGGSWAIRGSGNNISKPVLLTSGASTTISVNDPSLKINLDPTVSTKLAPQAGDRVWNTNAGFGAGIGMYGYTNAGAWSQIF